MSTENSGAKPVRGVDKIAWSPYKSLLTYYDHGESIHNLTERSVRAKGYPDHKKVREFHRDAVARSRDVASDAIMWMMYGKDSQ